MRIRSIAVAAAVVLAAACGGSRLDGLPLVTTEIAPETPSRYSLYVHCGAEYLGTLNDVFWVAPEGKDIYDWMPDEWDDGRPPDAIDVELVLSADGETIVASMNDRAVVYAPGDAQQAGGCD